ncbi:serine/threonine-protein kinase [Actinacidiphila alni]|uniref:serine/threonine-protein kinase n=1 Tax=Actinacidiphila alni TaxID=380248 RepID=UPI003453EDDC
MLLAERYRMQEPIGHGGMGEVWRAQDDRLGRTVAVKLLSGPGAAERPQATRFEREARISARLHHPHVVSVYDFGVYEGRCFLVMEYVEGGTLADELRRAGPLCLDRVAALAGQTAEGLAAAHRQGIVHRDVKPSNVLVDGEGAPKIADFGIARLHGAETTTEATAAGEVRGTTLYVAPETVLGRPTTAAGDVYSLGCSLYELLTGRPPFQAETPIAVLWQHVERPLEPLARFRPQAPADMCRYIEAMLAKDPARRPEAVDVADRFAGGMWDGVPLSGGPATLALPDPGPVTLATTTPVPVPRGTAHPVPSHALPRKRGNGRRVLLGSAVAAAAVAAVTVVLASTGADGHAPVPPSAVTSPSATVHHKGATSRPAQVRDADAPADTSGASADPAAGRSTSAPPTHTTAPPSGDVSAPASTAGGGAGAPKPSDTGSASDAPTPTGTDSGSAPPTDQQAPPTTGSAPTDAPTGPTDPPATQSGPTDAP